MKYQDLTTFTYPVRLAAYAHRGQLRKYDGLPYIKHPITVADTVRSIGAGRDVITAALLHDVVEDTYMTLDNVERAFGRRVADMVHWLTDDPRGDRNRMQHKIDLTERMQHAPPWVKTIKLADLIDNAESILQHDPNFAKVFMAEKVYLMRSLTEGHPALYYRATQLVRNSGYKWLIHASQWGAGLPDLIKISKRRN